MSDWCVLNTATASHHTILSKKEHANAKQKAWIGRSVALIQKTHTCISSVLLTYQSIRPLVMHAPPFWMIRMKQVVFGVEEVFRLRIGIEPERSHPQIIN